MAGNLIGDSLLSRIRTALAKSERGGGTQPPAVVPSTVARHQAWVKFKNVSSSTIPAYGVFVGKATAGTDGLYIEAKPSEYIDTNLAYINGAESVSVGSVGFCLIPGGEPCKAKYYGTAPSAGDLVGLEPGLFTLKKRYPGFRALTDGSGGYVWVVRDSFIPTYAVKAEEKVTASQSGQCAFWTDKDETAIGYTGEVYGTLLGDETLEIGDWGLAQMNCEGYWLLIVAECTETAK